MKCLQPGITSAHSLKGEVLQPVAELHIFHESRNLASLRADFSRNDLSFKFLKLP